MSRLIDFQIHAGSHGHTFDACKSVNEALFSTYEPVRLWLKEQSIQAPFRKLVVEFDDESLSAGWHGHIANAIGVCLVTEAIDVSELRRCAKYHSWVLKFVHHALESVSVSLSWRSEELNAFILALSAQPKPLTHYFERWTRTDKASGVKCVPWFSTQPGLSKVGVRLVSPSGAERNVIVAENALPLYMGDDFPIAKCSVRNSSFVLMDKAGLVLASVPIAETVAR
jgi:hypothetical protein